MKKYSDAAGSSKASALTTSVGESSYDKKSVIISNSRAVSNNANNVQSVDMCVNDHEESNINDQNKWIKVSYNKRTKAIPSVSEKKSNFK